MSWWWPFRKAEEPTPGALLARSMYHASTEEDWIDGGGYPTVFHNAKLGVTLRYDYIWEKVTAEQFQLSDKEAKQLYRAIRDLRGRRADRLKLAEFERIVGAFEKTLGTNG